MAIRLTENISQKQPEPTRVLRWGRPDVRTDRNAYTCRPGCGTMRRITIELTLKELGKFEGNTAVQKIKSLEILQFLREDLNEFAVICRIEFTDPNLTMEEFIDDEIIELQMLDHEKDGTYTYFLKSRPTTQPEPHFDPFSPGGYLSVPFEIRDGMAR